jgi:acylphosphatase
MGYGHQRTACALRDLAVGKKIINANDYKGIPKGDKNVWEGSRRFYEFVSRFKKAPFIGKIIFSLFDATQRITEFYPKRDLSQSNFTQKRTYPLFKRGWGRHLINKLSAKNGRPFVSTFYTPAFMAEYFNYPGDIYCVVCDADISRGWAPLKPGQSRIKYFAPTKRVVDRLVLYGIKKENIFLTGYPLPMEIIGKRLEKVKEDLKHRILNLDPWAVYQKKYGGMLKEKLGEFPSKADHPLTIMFAVGGAGAQKEMGVNVLKQLRDNISNGEVKVILVAGTKKKIKEYFKEEIEKLKISPSQERVEIIFEETFEKYFDSFNSALRKTDILWTKPSELSFYSALGLPIIIAPTIGSQEEFNRAWLLSSGFGAEEENTGFIKDWLFDWLKEGRLAEMALEGFIEGEQMGVLRIKDIIGK